MEDMVKMNDTLGFFKGKRVFITGHTGFKGAWLCTILKQTGADISGYALLPEPESLYNIASVEEGITSYIGDIRNIAQLNNALKKAQPEIVFHLAAQPIVREGYKDPVYTYSTNVMGTVNLLDCLRHIESLKSVVNITTDKVYENNDWYWGYRESDRLGGYDPYANSKSCSELVSQSFKNSFFDELGVSVSTARAGNVIGGGDFAKDRIIPDCVRAVSSEREIAIRNPFSIRPYQHVLEPLSAYLLIAREQYYNFEKSDAYNIGPNASDCLTTEELANLFCNFWGNGCSWTVQKSDSFHEDKVLKLNCDKISAVLGWKSKWNAAQAVEKTVDWYKAWLNNSDMKGFTEAQIKEYYCN